MDFKSIISTILNKLNFLDHEGRVSITNVCVAVFIFITAFRSLFGGSTFHIGTFVWAVQTIDYGDTLPLLYGLLNYSHKRSVTNSVTSSTTTNNQTGSTNGQ